MLTICFIALTTVSDSRPVVVNVPNIHYVLTIMDGDRYYGSYVETGGHSSNGGNTVRETEAEILAQIEEKCS